MWVGGRGRSRGRVSVCGEARRGWSAHAYRGVRGGNASRSWPPPTSPPRTRRVRCARGSGVETAAAVGSGPPSHSHTPPTTTTTTGTRHLNATTRLPDHHPHREGGGCERCVCARPVREGGGRRVERGGYRMYPREGSAGSVLARWAQLGREANRNETSSKRGWGGLRRVRVQYHTAYGECTHVWTPATRGGGGGLGGAEGGGTAAGHRGRAVVEPRGCGGEGEGEEWGGIRWGGLERAQKQRWGRQGGAGGRPPPP